MIGFDILVDDGLGGLGRRAEHGLSVLAEVKGCGGRVERYLFDVGQHAGTLSGNAEGVDLSGLDGVVLSHGHYDHTGGLGCLVERGVRCPVYVGPDVIRRRYSVQVGADGTLGRMRKQIGMPEPELLERFDSRVVSGVMEVSGSLTLFTLPEAAPPNARLLAADMRSADTFTDELFALVGDGEEEWLFGGCTHHGLPMLLEYVFGVMGRRRLAGFIGGLHLQGRSVEEVERVADVAAGYDVGEWRLVHCTGDVAMGVWGERFSGVRG